MALPVYQEVFARMVASTAFRRRVLDRPAEALDALDLTPRERKRLLAIAAQPGMRVSTAIHRANRLSPLEQTLPFTLFLLGEPLREILDRYWSEHPTETLQLPAECERFAVFLEGEIHAGRISHPYLEEVLAFERACTELRFFTEDEIQGGGAGGTRQMRVVAFRHPPEALLEALGAGQSPPADLEPGEFHLLIDCRSGEPDFRLLDADALHAFEQRNHPHPGSGASPRPR